MDEAKSILEDLEPSVQLASTSRIMAANAIDWIVQIALIVGFYYTPPRQFTMDMLDYSPFVKFLIVILIMNIYRLVAILSIGRTIGMILVQTKYLNEKLEELTITEKLIAVAAGRTKKIRFFKV